MWVFLFNFGSMETAKVIRAFTCVNTRVRYNVGDSYTADSHRISQLAAKGYVKAEPRAHIPKAEVAEQPKAEVKQSTKRKRNEQKKLS